MIPTTWVFQSNKDSGKITIFSKWPPGLYQDVTSETIKNATIPTQDWSSYKICLLDNGKEYCEYCKIKYLLNYCTQVHRYTIWDRVAHQATGEFPGVRFT